MQDWRRQIKKRRGGKNFPTKKKKSLSSEKDELHDIRRKRRKMFFEGLKRRKEFLEKMKKEEEQRKREEKERKDREEREAKDSQDFLSRLTRDLHRPVEEPDGSEIRQAEGQRDPWGLWPRPCTGPPRSAMLVTHVCLLTYFFWHIYCYIKNVSWNWYYCPLCWQKVKHNSTNININNYIYDKYAIIECFFLSRPAHQKTIYKTQ